MPSLHATKCLSVICLFVSLFVSWMFFLTVSAQHLHAFDFRQTGQTSVSRLGGCVLIQGIWLDLMSDAQYAGCLCCCLLSAVVVRQEFIHGKLKNAIFNYVTAWELIDSGNNFSSYYKVKCSTTSMLMSNFLSYTVKSFIQRVRNLCLQGVCSDLTLVLKHWQ